jgi:hypothetical protein
MQSFPFLFKRTQSVQVCRVQVCRFDSFEMEDLIVVEQIELNRHIREAIWRSGLLVVEFECVCQLTVKHTPGRVSIRWVIGELGVSGVQRYMACLLSAFSASPSAIETGIGAFRPVF